MVVNLYLYCRKKQIFTIKIENKIQKKLQNLKRINTNYKEIALFLLTNKK